MGQVASVDLTQNDVDEVLAYCNNCFTQKEVEGLYKRFRSVDRGRKGYIHADEFLTIPELSINPMASRLVRMFESVNFRDFAKLLSAFGSRATRAQQLAFMFQVFDVDGDGVIGRDDMLMMLRQAAGSSLTEDDLKELVDQLQEQAAVQQREMLLLPTSTVRPIRKSLSASSGDFANLRAGSNELAMDLQTFQHAMRDVDLTNMTIEIPVAF